MKLVIFSAISIGLFISPAIGDFDPNQFVIGAWGGPELFGSVGLDANNGYILNENDTVAYRDIQNDHYNAICVNIPLKNEMYHIFDGCAGEPSVWVKPVLTGDISNRYRLACLSHYNLKTMILGKIIGDSPNLYWSRSDPYGQPEYICGERGWYDEALFAGNTIRNELKRYQGLGANQTDKILGYFLGNEPNTYPQTTTTLLNNMDTIHKYEPQRPALVNLLPMNHYCSDIGGSSFSSESEYRTYISAYANRANVKMLCFGIYPIIDNTVSPATAGFWNTYGNDPLNGSRMYFFRNYHLFISLKKPDQKFWAIIQGGRPDQDYINFAPNEKSARFCLNSALIYGAQGIWWYCWRSPFSHHNIYDHPIRDTIAVLNREIQTMAPVLMRLTWITTVHGQAIDPQSGETGLATPDQETHVLKMGPSANLKYLAIGVFKNGVERYIMVFNKNLTDTTYNKSIVLNDTTYTPTSFNKTKGTWETMPFRQDIPNNTTSITVGLPPAEMKLIKLN